jgi:hypothetical protein
VYQTRILQLGTLGTIAEIMLDEMVNSKLKATRRRAFGDMEKLIRLSKLIPDGAYYQAISRGADSKGNPIILVYFFHDADVKVNQEISDPKPEADRIPRPFITHN